MRQNLGKPRVLLADDHSMLVDGLSRLLEPEFEIVGKVADGRALLDSADRLKPDVIVADVSMPLLNGIEAVRQLKRTKLRAKVIFISMHTDIELGVEALRIGASGYVLKHSAGEALSHAIREALAGRLYVSPRIALDVFSTYMEGPQQSNKTAGKLTQREREVLQLVAEGRTLRGIANILKITIRTVLFHKGNLMDKLGLRTTADLTRYAIRSGLIRTSEVEGAD
jgi:DNA-binding NarL/FixJ family response regulator